MAAQFQVTVRDEKLRKIGGVVPVYAGDLKKHFESAYSMTNGFKVRLRDDSTSDGIRYYVYVHKGWRSGFVVTLLSSPASPAALVVKVVRSSALFRTFACLAAGALIAVVTGVMIYEGINLGSLPGKREFVPALWLGFAAFAVVLGLGVVTARVLTASAGNPFTDDKLSEIGETAKGALEG